MHKENENNLNADFFTVFDYGNKTKRKQTLSYGIFEFYWIKKNFFFSFSWFIGMMNSKNTKMQKQNLKQKKQFIWIFSVYEWKKNASKHEWCKDRMSWFTSLSSDTKCCRLEIMVGKMDDGSLMDRPKNWSGGRYD